MKFPGRRHNDRLNLDGPLACLTDLDTKSSNIAKIAVIDVTKSRTGNYDFCACVRARGFPGRTLFGRIRFAVCAERSLDNNLRFLRKCHPDKIWNTLITITYLHRYFSRIILIDMLLKTSCRFLNVLNFSLKLMLL